MLEFLLGGKGKSVDPKDPSENWGNCAKPNCQYQSQRCALNMCMRCCYLQHHHIDHRRPWIHESEKRALVVVPHNHPATCLCVRCVTEAKLKARDQREADKSKLPEVYQEPKPEAPEPGKMEERDLIDWPLERDYLKAKTVWTQQYYGGY